MCNACGFSCCAFDDFEGCGCNCDEWRCRVARCGGCGQMVDATDPGADCECFPSDEDDWTWMDERQADAVYAASHSGHAIVPAEPRENGRGGS